jgi:hypothetical protein
MHGLEAIKAMNAEGPRIVKSEDLELWKNEHIRIEMVLHDWVDEQSGLAWKDHVVYFTAECGGLSLFSFQDKDKAYQLFELMKVGV